MRRLRQHARHRFVNRFAIDSKHRIRAFDTDDTDDSAAARAFSGAGDIIPVPVAVSRDGGPSAAPYTDGSAAHPRRRAEHAPTKRSWRPICRQRIDQRRTFCTRSSLHQRGSTNHRL